MPRPSPAETADLIRRHCPSPPALAVVLGSGFGAVLAAAQTEATLDFADLPGFIAPSVPGHRGRLLVGRLGGAPVILLAGRAHFYEGHPMAEVVFPIRVLAELGIRVLLLTNAAGGIRPDLAPGDLVMLTDHLNCMGANPLRGESGPGRFVDLSEVYDARLRERLRQAAASENFALKEGIYAAVSGPSYETPAEVRALAALGADLVGMSTVPEAITARARGLQVAGLSCVTNRAAGLGGRISHKEVLETGRRVAPIAQRLLVRFASLVATGAPG